METRFKYRSIVMAFLMVFTTSCQFTEEDQGNIDKFWQVDQENQDQGPLDPLDPGCHAERFIQPEAEVTKNIDILFVTDTSGSLAGERAAIADGIDSFILALPEDVNYRVAVMLAHGSSSQWGGKLYQKGSEPHVLKSEEMSLPQLQNALYQKLYNPATDMSTDGGEAGLFSLSYGLQSPQLELSQSQGFFREDAALAVVFVADENDICAIYPEGVIPVPDYDHREGPAANQYCKDGDGNPVVTHTSVLQQLSALKGEQPLLVTGIIYTDPDTIPFGSENEVGYGYTDIIAASSGGIAVDLASGDYEVGLGHIGMLASIKLELITDFTLSEENVLEDSIRVEVDTEEVGFQYIPDLNQVHVPEPGGATSVVDIYYCTDEDDGGGDGPIGT